MPKNHTDDAAQSTTEKVWELLVRHRDRDPQAARDLIQHFLPLADRYIGRHKRGLGAHPRLDREDLEQQVYLDLAEAVAALATPGNDIPSDDVERFVAGHLTYSLTHLLASESVDVLASPSDRRREKRIAMRLNKPKEPTILKRCRGRHRLDATAARDAQDRSDIDSLCDPRAASPQRAGLALKMASS